MTQLSKSFLNTGHPIYTRINGVITKLPEDEVLAKDSNENIFQVRTSKSKKCTYSKPKISHQSILRNSLQYLFYRRITVEILNEIALL